jgi:hypothetical protein
MVEAVHGTAQEFDGDSLAFLRGVMKGTIQPDPARMAAATALAKYEYPQLAATAVVNGGSSLESLVELAGQRIGALTYEERAARASALISRVKAIAAEPGKLIDAEPVTPASTDTAAAEMRESIRRVEAENQRIKDDIARQEQEDRNRQDRLRTSGVDYVAFGQRR